MAWQSAGAAADVEVEFVEADGTLRRQRSVSSGRQRLMSTAGLALP
jgi:hypothetical protein